MTKPTSDNTVRIHRVFKAPANVVYRAFLEPQAKCKWLPPYGFFAEMQHDDQKVGGSYHMSFTNFRTGQSHAFGGKYIELIPNKRLRYTDKFDDPNMQNEIMVTVELREVLCGTEITVVQENLPPQIPVEFCYLGWQESLMQLAHLVEPEITQ